MTQILTVCGSDQSRGGRRLFITFYNYTTVFDESYHLATTSNMLNQNDLLYQLFPPII